MNTTEKIKIIVMVFWTRFQMLSNNENFMLMGN